MHLGKLTKSHQSGNKTTKYEECFQFIVVEIVIKFSQKKYNLYIIIYGYMIPRKSKY